MQDVFILYDDFIIAILHIGTQDNHSPIPNPDIFHHLHYLGTLYKEPYLLFIVLDHLFGSFFTRNCGYLLLKL